MTKLSETQVFKINHGVNSATEESQGHSQYLKIFVENDPLLTYTFPANDGHYDLQA